VRKACGPREFAVKENFRSDFFVLRTVHKQRNSTGLIDEGYGYGQNCGLNSITPQFSNTTVPPQLAAKSDSSVALFCTGTSESLQEFHRYGFMEHVE
jgi:hypothetical protein